jgi:hypothetical protein
MGLTSHHILNRNSLQKEIPCIAGALEAVEVKGVVAKLLHFFYLN